MIYKEEAGALIDQQDQVITFLKGSSSSVDFPTEMIWNIHNLNPGYLYKFAHTHPPRMDSLSDTDMKMLCGWAMALHPFPISMSVITMMEKRAFTETTFTAFLEPKEFWEKGSQRETIIQEIKSTSFSMDWLHYHGPEWRRKLVLRSYEFEENKNGGEEDEVI